MAQDDKQLTPSPIVTETVTGEEKVSSRWFTPSDLEAIADLLSDSHFDEASWHVEDQHGEFSSESFRTLLPKVDWASIQYFRATATQSRKREEEDLPLLDEYAFAHLNMSAFAKYPEITVEWRSQVGTDREGTERTARAVVRKLESQPKKFGNNGFRESHDAGPRWYDLRRRPESIVDWAVAAFLGAAAMSLVGGVILLVRLL